MQLPMRANWNAKLVNIGDGGKDGDLDFADNYVAEGYATANSNMGHDVGSTPGATFAYENLESMIDFGHRAVHLTANASKAIVRAFIDQRRATRTSRAVRQEAARFLTKRGAIRTTDGIARRAVYDYQALNVSHVWMAQRVFADNFAGNLAFDKDGDGI
jgi:hypothetical protein